MKRKHILVISLAAFVILFAAAGFLYNSLKDHIDTERLLAYEQSENESASASTEDEQVAEEQTAPSQAPDFIVYTPDGSMVRLSDYQGTPVVLNFWSCWCDPCKRELPTFEEKYLEYGDEVQFLMVNLTNDSRETMDVVSGFIAENGYTFPVVYDKDSIASSAFKLLYIPATYFIDSQGYIVAQVIGAIDEGSLQEGIEMIQQ